MELDSKKIFKTLNPNKVWIPILFGVAIVFYRFYTDDSITYDNLNLIFSAKIIPFVLAILLILARFLGYMYRIRAISSEELSWGSSMYIIILWEFASAVTPSVVGGTAVAVFILLKEGINLGKSLAFVMLTAILDNLFFVVAALVSLIAAPDAMFPSNLTTIDGIEEGSLLFGGLKPIFYVSYLLIMVYTFIMFYALFVRPRAFKWFLLKVTSIRYLKKWRYRAYEYGNEIIWASANLKGKRLNYWINISLVTIFIWSVRYLQLNLLIEAYSENSLLDHIIIYSRQIILWITMLIAPTPGGSGFAEYFFEAFFARYLQDYTLVTMVLWRILSYYPFLLLGAIFLPRWIKRVFFKKQEKKDAPSDNA
ncbi:lysylphosphatidylglycerol synthase transmembrane domain-containing protein [Fulvivirgaceae bacterium BMA12]|uniref:Lysylphosphatidylglycerol synthase transmembrane domain-containing protein n=1 Tax=Agaribacillus aureus TaxID=3051825 RepID=A0ABT8LH70_9BACT|nr:lysylphosphatidylglycerol synthase transmembrane domain-containing protein [Fulvivirgaceae bacterium BMA12]